MGSNFGIKVSQPGRDVVSAGDQELLFSSSWPTLPIIYQGAFKGVSAGNPTVLVRHNLGFVPAFIAYGAGLTGGYGVGAANVSADKINIYFHANVGITLDVLIIVFNLDLEKNFNAPNVNTGSSSLSHGSKDFGIKLSKESKDVSSHDLRDYLLHSSTRGPLIHTVFNGYGQTPGIGTTKNLSFTHDLPYSPIYMAYAQTPAGDMYFFVSTVAVLKTIGNTITIQNINADKKGAFVILKDPFFITDNNITI